MIFKILDFRDLNVSEFNIWVSGIQDCDFQNMISTDWEVSSMHRCLPSLEPVYWYLHYCKAHVKMKDKFIIWLLSWCRPISQKPEVRRESPDEDRPPGGQLVQFLHISYPRAFWSFPESAITVLETSLGLGFAHSSILLALLPPRNHRIFFKVQRERAMLRLPVSLKGLIPKTIEVVYMGVHMGVYPLHNLSFSNISCGIWLGLLLWYVALNLKRWVTGRSKEGEKVGQRGHDWVTGTLWMWTFWECDGQFRVLPLTGIDQNLLMITLFYSTRQLPCVELNHTRFVHIAPSRQRLQELLILHCAVHIWLCPRVYVFLSA